MIERLRFALKPGDPVRIGRDFVGQDLKGNLTAERGVERFPDNAHPTLPDLFYQAIV